MKPKRTSGEVSMYLAVATRVALRQAMRTKNAIKPSPFDEAPGFLVRKLAEEVGEVAEALINGDTAQAVNELGDLIWTATMLLVRLGEK